MFFAFVFCVFLGFNTRLEAQEHYVRNFNMLDGLPGNAINQIYEDSRGVVWIATNAGVYQFDGTRVIYRNALEELQGEQVKAITEDKDKNLLLSIQGRGVFKFMGDSLSPYQLKGNLAGSEVNCFLYNSQAGKLWLGTGKGLFEIEEPENTPTQIKLSELGNISHLRKSEDRIFAYSSEQSFVIPEGKREKEVPIIKFGEPETKLNLKLEKYSEFSLLIDDKLVKADVIQILNQKSDEYCLLRYYLQGRECRKLVQFTKGRFTDYGKQNNLEDLFIECIYSRENQNDIWIGTKNYGLYCIRKSIFTYFNLNSNNLQDVVIAGNNDIYAAGSSSVYILKNNRLVGEVNDKQFCEAFGKSKKCNKELHIYDIEFKDEEHLWIATNKGFFELQVKERKLVFKGITAATDFTFDGKNSLLSFWNNSLTHFTLQGKQVEKQVFRFEESTPIEVSNMVKHSSGVWIATKQKGIVKYKDKSFSVYNRNNSGIHNVVNDIAVLPDTSIIAGGNNGIIYRLREQNNKLRIVNTLDQNDGVKGTSIHGFQYVGNGELWFGTNVGVHEVDYYKWIEGKDSKLLYWNSLEGYFDQPGRKSCVDKLDRIWVQTHGRLMRIDTKDLVNNGHICKLTIKNVFLTKLKSSGESIKKNIWTQLPSEPIEIDYKQNNVSFSFGCEFCVNPDNIKIRYKLEGLDDYWSAWNSNKEAIFTNLPSGEYTLHYQGKHLNNGSITGGSHQILVKTPWWASIWFILAMLVLLIWIVFFGFKLYAAQIRREEKGRNKQFRRVIGLKIQSLQNQMDPHFIFNSLNSIQSFILEEKSDEALEYLSDFSMVLRKNIDNANRNFIKLSDEVSYLKNYLKLEQMRFSDRFAFNVHVAGNVNPLKMTVPPMLIQPFLENAIKYGLSGLENWGELKLEFEMVEDDLLKCVIIDNGIGRKKARELHEGSHIQEQHKSLTITRDRMKLLNKVNSGLHRFEYKIEDMKNDNGSPSGTKVEIMFPKMF